MLPVLVQCVVYIVSPNVQLLYIYSTHIHNICDCLGKRVHLLQNQFLVSKQCAKRHVNSFPVVGHIFICTHVFSTMSHLHLYIRYANL